jgi:hypothetical protein
VPFNPGGWRIVHDADDRDAAVRYVNDHVRQGGATIRIELRDSKGFEVLWKADHVALTGEVTAGREGDARP